MSAKAKKNAMVPAPATKPEAWMWDDKREQALEMAFAGFPKTQIANEVGVHRNTILAWFKAREFQVRLAQRTQEHVDTIRQRRLVETTRFADKAAQLADRALKEAAADARDAFKASAARAWSAEFRQWREQERRDFGDDVQRHDHRVAGVVARIGVGTMEPAEGPTTATSFREYLERQIDDGVIDVEVVDARDPTAIVAAFVEQAMIDGGLLDRVNDEDLASASPGTKGSSK